MAQTLVSLLAHIVFSTKNRMPLITPDIEIELHPYMAGTANNLGCRCLAINGTENHVHLFLSLSKNLALSAVVAEIKKSSSKWIKTKGPEWQNFKWQVGYGAFSIGESNVAALKRYIAGQKEHHRHLSFEEEFLTLLEKYQVTYDTAYLWQ